MHEIQSWCLWWSGRNSCSLSRRTLTYFKALVLTKAALSQKKKQSVLQHTTKIAAMPGCAEISKTLLKPLKLSSSKNCWVCTKASLVCAKAPFKFGAHQIFFGGCQSSLYYKLLMHTKYSLVTIMVCAKAPFGAHQ